MSAAELRDPQAGGLLEGDLLEAVLAAPDDDAPRLVYADALLDRGDPRGELIVVQLQLARERMLDARRAELESAAAKLVREHTAHMQASYAALNAGFVFRRGFVEQLTAPARAILGGSAFAELMAKEPVRELMLLEVDDAAAEEIAALPLMRRIAHLGCRGRLGARGAQSLAAAPALAELRSLDLAGATLGEAGCAALARSAVLAPTSLALNATAAGDGGAVALADGIALRRCRRLLLARNRIGARGAEALARSEVLQEIELLSLTGNGDLGSGRWRLTERWGRRVAL
jgi:uncharacterized protein (TIGR02996 family)